MIELYNFKVGDEVWHISEPGRYGIVSSISQFDNTIWVQWTSLCRIAYNSGVRPKSLNKNQKPYSCGVMRHTHHTASVKPE